MISVIQVQKCSSSFHRNKSQKTNLRHNEQSFAQVIGACMFKNRFIHAFLIGTGLICDGSLV